MGNVSLIISLTHALNSSSENAIEAQTVDDQVIGGFQPPASPEESEEAEGQELF